MPDSILQNIRNSVLIITLNRPGVKNKINTQMVAQLADIKDSINSDDHIRAIIITGAGEKVFSMGTDLKEFRSAVKGWESLKRFSVALVLNQITKPIIAVINGDAFGQGLELALACDLRICSARARFAMPQILQGGIPWDGGTQNLPRLVGRSKGLELILSGKTIDAQEAHEIGLVSRVAPPDKLMRVAMNIARAMAAKAPIALRYAKELIKKGMDMTLEQGLSLEADLYSLLHTTRDRNEGIRAFLEKRSPKFDGR
jgi:enoyl-CoA hydratase/carnithine racemase